MHLLNLLCFALLGAVPTLSVDYKKKFEEAEKTGGLTPLERQLVLNAHNHFRRKVAQGKFFKQPSSAAMPLMMWDDRLADMALDWAKQLRESDVFDHSTEPIELDFAGVGESIAAFGKNQRNMMTMIHAFYKEGEFYDFATGTCDYKNPRNAPHTCGHYIQGIQAETNYVGCQAQFHSWKNSLMFVCKYRPKKMGGQPYEAGEPCSNCHWQATWCVNGTCVNKEVCERTKNCECKKICTNGAKIDDRHCVCQKDCPPGKACYVRRKFRTLPDAVNVLDISPLPDHDCFDVPDAEFCQVGDEVFNYCFNGPVPYGITCLRTCNTCLAKKFPKKDWMEGDGCEEALEGTWCEQENVKLLCWDTCKRYKKKS